jgi:hypothetical protein
MKKLSQELLDCGARTFRRRLVVSGSRTDLYACVIVGEGSAGLEIDDLPILFATSAIP